MTTEKTNRFVAHVIYAGQHQPGLHEFIKIDDADKIHNIKEIADDMTRHVYKSKLFKHARIGSIFQVESDTKDFRTIYYNINSKPVSMFYGDIRMQWEVLDRQSNQIIRLKKQLNESQFKKNLQHVRNAYIKASSAQRSLIIADVVRFITEGK